MLRYFCAQTRFSPNLTKKDHVDIIGLGLWIKDFLI